MNARIATEQDRDRWNQFVLSSPTGSFLQSWAWGEFQRALAIPFWRLLVESDGKLEAVALVLRRKLPFGRCWLYVPRGPHFAPLEGGATRGKPALMHTAWEALQKKLLELAHLQRAVFVTIDPLWDAGGGLARRSLDEGGWRKSSREIQPQHTVVLDLTLSEERLLKDMHEKTRYNIRLAARKGVRVRFSRDPHDLEHFLHLARAVEARQPFHYHPDMYYRTMREVLGGSFRMLEVGLAEYEGQVIAADLFITAGATTTYAHGASEDVHRAVMGPSLLMWEAILRAQKQGVHRFDFFGVAPPDAGVSHPWAGITRFKEGFNGKREAYIGAYDLVLSSALYVAYNVTRRARAML